MAQTEKRTRPKFPDDSPAPHPAKVITRILQEVRDRLGLEVAFVSEFKDGHRVYRLVEGDGEGIGIVVGAGDPLEDSYCHRVVEGSLPSLVQDAQNNPLVSGMDVTAERQIGCYIGVPVVFSDGTVFGTFCCLDRGPGGELTDREVEFMRIMVGTIAEQLEREEMQEQTRAAASMRIQKFLDGDGLHMVYQPIRDLLTGEIVGAEALARFELEPRRGPDQWFADAWTTGLGMELELKAIQLAAEKIDLLPRGAYLSVNLSPETAMSPKLTALMRTLPADRMMLELTEHERVTAYEPLRQALQEHRAAGTEIAIDDAGAGYAGITHLLELKPDLVKLDVVTTRGIESDHRRQSLVGAVVAFTAGSSLQVLSEGIETEAELATLRDLGMRLGQGYHLGRPGELPFAD